MSKEKNFMSAIVYLHNNEADVTEFFDKINACFYQHFEKYELIAVDDACTDGTIDEIRKWAKTNTDYPLTIIHMSVYHRKEDAMNAGIDAAIGDYIYEFDSTQIPEDTGLIFRAYEMALEGNDIICVSPKRIKASSKFFYDVFNKNSKAKYKLQTDAFRLVTRRAINRVHASNAYMPYRKAAYAASGLRMQTLNYDGEIKESQGGKTSLAIDSLILYTNAGFKVSMGITFFMMAVALAELVYTVVIYCIGKPIEGWTTMMLVMTFGFLGLFIILSLIIRYLILNLDMSFRKQKYLIESTEKIQK